jgi:myosin heavy subunit
MEAFESSKPDRLHQSLSSTWANFLGAQHCSREVDSLKKALDQHVQQMNLSITTLQRDAGTRHDLLAASVTDAKSKVEQHVVEIRNLATLRTDFLTFQYEVGQNRENVARKVTDLFEKSVAQQESLDGLRSTTSHDIKAIQEQYHSALEKVESLQQELREARAERLASEHKLAALESQVTAMSQTQQQLPTDIVNFLGEIHSCREGLMRLLDKQDLENPAQSLAPPSNQTSMPFAQTPAASYGSLPYEQTPAPIVHRDEHDTSEDDRPPTRTKRRRPENPLQPQTERPVPPQAPSQDIRSLYLVFRDKYKETPPKSDTVFIWRFISSIEDPAISRHIQESLVTILPEYVKPTRDKRCKNPLKYVDISKKLTWRMFREALVKIPGPSR